MTPQDPPRPLAAAYRTAEVAYDAAAVAIEQATCCPGRCSTCEPLWEAAEAADEAVVAARGAWLAGDEPRDWRIDHERLQDVAPSAVEERLEAWARARAAEAPSLTTRWRSILAVPIDPTTDDPISDVADWAASVSVTIDPAEPACAGARRHAWLAPFSVVGGTPEEPGVHAHGGGLVVVGVCAYCGWYRTTDTWATDPGTGREGLVGTTYREPDAPSRAWSARVSSILAAVES